MRALFILTISSVFVVPAAAQDRCKWTSGDTGSVSTYPQQLNIDVGDTPGHIIGVYELHSVARPNSKPNCEGLKDKEVSSYGTRDYRDRNGRASGYIIETLENGDKIYQEFSGTTQTAIAADGSKKTTYEGVAYYVGGTGRYQTVRGYERDHLIVDWPAGESKPSGTHSTAEGEYWFEK